MKKLRGLLSVLAILFVCHIPMQVQAETFYNNPRISFSPDGEAWTIYEELPYTDIYFNYWESGTKPEYWYENGYTRTTGIQTTIRALQVGEHYYTYERYGEVPVGKWVVEHPEGKCVHGSIKDVYHGVPNVRAICFNAYYSGWMAYCADCGERITPALVYMSKDAMNTLDSIDVNKHYYYVCPTNGHIDNTGSQGWHECKTISPNRYRVVYEPNCVVYSGDMMDSFHMYNNATEYEGNPVTPITKLSTNSYVRLGYTLAGWNTEPDGSGTFFEPEATILNLSSYDYNEDEIRGTVTLYAQWVTTENTLQINPNGGTYDGNSGISSFTQGYGTKYHADPSKIVAPKGATVTFQTNGGNAVSPITGTRYFVEWQESYPFHGYFNENNNNYHFEGKMGEVDTLTAQYGWNSITLPGTTRPNYSFGGWYADAGCTQYVGTKGDTVTLYQDTTLYAKWVTLVLTSKDNYVAHNKSGAVDLKWHQNDSVSKIYKVMQLKDGEAVWKQVYNESVVGNQTQATKTFNYTGGVQTYTVAYNGYYTVSATGGKGGNYGSYAGGKGGYVSGQYWLKKGDVVRVYVGGQGSGTTGGKNGSGAYQGANSYASGSGGGAATVITVTRNGSTSTLMIAGGGGGANVGFAGGAGGTGGGSTTVNGLVGVGGGGGGLKGGSNGNYQEAVPAVTLTEITGSTIYMKTGREYIEWQGDYAYHPTPELYETINGVKYRVVQTTSGETLYSTIWGNIVPDGVVTTGSSSSLTLKWGSRCEGDCGGTGYHITWGDLCNGIIKFYRKTIGAGTPEKKNAAKGGTNYYNTGFSAKNISSQAGTNNGNGAVVISVTNLGFQDTNYLNGVKATDYAAPNAVSEMEYFAQGTQDYITVEWENPGDNGTGYKHIVYSYPMSNTNTYIASNITYNVLTTQVKGYYCIVDTTSNTTITKSNLGTYIADNNGGTVNVKMDGQTVKYLHVAAMDWAGNLGATSHLKLDPAGIAWDLFTEQIKITDVIGTKDYGTVYTKGDGKYYVRADGKGPFQLSYESKMNGSARDNYQIDYQIFDSTTSAGVNQRYITKLPYTNPLTSTSMLSVSEFVRKVEGGEVLTDAMNTGAMRTSTAARNYFYQSFTMPKSLHGQTIVVTPVVGATYGKDIKYSTWADDVLHSITLIADGEAPIVTGDEVLQGLTEINRDEQDIYLDLVATDDLSGVRDFKVHIFNNDSTESADYTPDADGHIRIHLTADETLFYGDLSITIETTDNVGNTRNLQYGALEFALQAKVERILPPHAPIFQRGESGILSITTWGYADRVEVELPQELLNGNPDLLTCFDYTEHAMYSQREEIQFMIPLDMPLGKDYSITVRAYKDGTQLEAYPNISVLEVEGTVLDEFRTRLR